MDKLGEKAYFLRNEFVTRLRTIDPAATPIWGKMNVAQMIEHMSYALRQASGKETYTLLTPEEHVPRMQAFLMSDKPFKENTPNQLLPDEPDAPKHADINAALEELGNEIKYFFSVFERSPHKKITNPFFGELNYDMWVQLLYKHAWHHLKQFGIEMPAV